MEMKIPSGSGTTPMEVEPVAVIDPKLWKWADQRLDARLGTRPTRSIVTRRSGTSNIYKSFWENKMLQAQ